MIVEFLGISGVGKSYIATQYGHYLDNLGIDYVWPWQGIYSKGYISRNIQKSVAVLRWMMTSPRWCYRLFRYLRQQCICGKRDLPVLFFNGVFLHHALEKYGGFLGVALFDEGLAQYLWAVHFRNRKQVTTNELEIIRGLFRLPQRIYVVTANSDVILKRMEGRNVRDEIRERGDAMCEVENGQRVVDLVAQTFASIGEVSIFYIDNNDNGVSKARLNQLFNDGIV